MRPKHRPPRPLLYSARHHIVAALKASGLSRKEVANLSGYSVTHVSRILQMREAREVIANAFAEKFLARQRECRLAAKAFRQG